MKRKTPQATATPAQIKAARQAAGLTQGEAGALIHCTGRAWGQWESGDNVMHLAFWELFQIKVAKHGSHDRH